MGRPPSGSGEAGVAGVCFEVGTHKDEAHHIVHAWPRIGVLFQQCIHQQAHVIAVLPWYGSVLATVQGRNVLTSLGNCQTEPIKGLGGHKSSQKNSYHKGSADVSHACTAQSKVHYWFFGASAHLMIFMVMAPRFGASKALRRQHIS